MSETCCYCGNDREETPAIHADWVGHAFVVRQAEYAALDVAHDESVAAFEDELDKRDTAWDDHCRRHNHTENMLRRRAESAEAQLATARADGARSAFEWLGNTPELLLPWTDVDEDWPTIADLLAAWQAAQQTGTT